MRLELALIVGILFFCSWCAYIIIKMNSSVATSPPTPPLQPPQQASPLALNETYLSSGSQQHPYHRYNSNQLVPIKPPYEGSPTAAYYSNYSNNNAYAMRVQPQTHQLAPHLQQPQPQQPRQPQLMVPYGGASWPAAAPATSATSTWRDYSSSNSHTAQPTGSWQRYQRPPARHAHSAYQYPRTESGDWRPSAPLYATASRLPIQPQQQQQQSFASAAKTNEEQQDTNDSDPDPDDQNVGGGEESNQSDDGAQPENREFEEEVGRRTYSEDEADANERDRDGNLMVTHRKHLINGKPVASSSSPSGAATNSNDNTADNENDDGEPDGAASGESKGSDDDADEEVAAGRAKRRRRNNSQNAKTSAKADRDFERIASEIDSDNQRTATANNDYDEGPIGSSKKSSSTKSSSLSSKLPFVSKTAKNDAKMRAVDSKQQQQQPEAVESRQRKVAVSALANTGASQGLLNLDEPLIGSRTLPGARKLIQSSISSTSKGSSPSSANSQPVKPSPSLLETKSRQKASKAKPKESHEHRLRESLREQHWDDDASSPNPQSSSDDKFNANATNNVDINDVESLEEEDNEQPPVEQLDAPEPEEPQQVDSALNELDMLVDPDRFMSDSENGANGSADSTAEKRRRKRQADIVDGKDTNSTYSADSSSVIPAIVPKEPDSLSGAEEINVDVIEPPPPPTTQYDYRGENLPPPMSYESAPPPPSSDHFPPSPPQSPEQSPSEMQQPQEDPYAFYGQQQPPPPQPMDPSQPPPPLVNHNGHSGGHAQPQTDQPGQPSAASVDAYYGAPMQYPEAPGMSQNQQVMPINGQQVGSGISNFAYVYPATASSKSMKKVKKKKKKFRRSKMEENKRKAAKTSAMKKKSKLKKGGRNKKRKKAQKKFAHTYKEFEGLKKGQKKAKGGGNKGANKGALYYKDKGYKKRGFKKAYSKLESGDHKMYFDEFRDKDHNKKWKNFKDKQHYSQNKHWTGKDKKKYKNYHLKELKDRKYGTWRDKAAHKYKKESKQHKDSMQSKRKKLKYKKNKLKKKKVEDKFAS